MANSLGDSIASHTEFLVKTSIEDWRYNRWWKRDVIIELWIANGKIAFEDGVARK